LSDASVVTADETAALVDAKRFRVVAIVAGIVAIPFALAHLTFGVTLTAFESMYADMGGEIPALTSAIFNLGSTGLLAVVLLAVDISIFVVMYRLAKRYWIGLLFVPVLAYLAISALLVPVIYLPLYQVISVIE